MADVMISKVCTNYEPGDASCRLNGEACPFKVKDFAQCGDSAFVARVVMPPDEFNVLLNGAGQPALGTMMVIRCRRPELHHGAAGVYVNAVLESAGEEAMLEARWELDGSVEYCCAGSDVKMIWRDGKFIPA